jgi:hypothetical protein
MRDRDSLILENLYESIVLEGEIYSPVKQSDIDTGAYHFGDGGVAHDTTLRRMDAGRSTGHFGTGTYFLGNKEEGYGREGRPLINIDLSGLKMATPNKSAKELHYGLRDFNRAIMKNDKLQFDEPRFDGGRILHTIWLSLLGNSVSEGKIKKAMLDVEDMFKEKGNDKLRTPSTYLMQELGFDGIDVRGTDADNTEYGSVIFAKPVLEN